MHAMKDGVSPAVLTDDTCHPDSEMHVTAGTCCTTMNIDAVLAHMRSIRPGSAVENTTVNKLPSYATQRPCSPLSPHTICAPAITTWAMRVTPPSPAGTSQPVMRRRVGLGLCSEDTRQKHNSPI